MVVGLDGVESRMLEVISRSPLSRIGQPDETAGVQAFLLSDEAKYSRSSLAPKFYVWPSLGTPRQISGLSCFKHILHEFSCFLKRVPADWRTLSVTRSVCTIDGGMLA